MTSSWTPLVAVLIPTVASVLILAASRRPNVREACTIVAAFGLLAATGSMLPQVLAGEAPGLTLFELVPGIALALRADAAGMIFALSASALWVLTSFYSIGYVRGLAEHRQTRYFASFALCLATTVGLALSANLLTFFVFYELLTVATYPLVVHKETPEALRAGRRYLAYLLSGGVTLLLALALVYAATGTLEFRAGGFLAGVMPPEQIVLVAALLAVGFGTKSAVMPLHAWLPSAMVAPTPVSALLHAVAVVKAGVFGYARAIGFVIGPQALHDVGAAAVLATVAAATILLASLTALRQDNLKRRLAFSTIAHLSYIVLGLSVLSATAWSGAMLHIVNHATLKITLFFCAGAIYVTARLDRVSDLDGIGRQMPVTMGAFAVASVGLAGLPPVSGFWSKWFLAAGAVDAGQWAFMVVLLGSGLLTAGYLFPIAYRAFMRPQVPGAPRRGEASPLMAAPLAITAALSLLFGVSNLLGVDRLVADVAAAVTGGAPLVTGVGP